MRVVDLMHRWTGGVMGLLLMVMGLSGTLLVHQDAWLRATLPHAAEPLRADDARIAAVVAAQFADPATAPRSVLFASDALGVHRLSYADPGAGAYLDQDGRTVTRWSSKWERPELWLFDLHHYLLIGPTGAVIAGFVALAGLGFVLTGLLLWWRTRRTFAFRLWPRRWSRPAVLRHHRDLGVVVAPILLLSFVTGAAMTLKPIEQLLTRPFSSPAEMARAARLPVGEAGSLDRPNWTRIIATARERFPDAGLRVLALPSRPGQFIALRMHQPGEWTPNGRTFLWFDPADGRLVGFRDALAAPRGAVVASSLYPLHSGKAGGLAWRFVMTLSGLALAMLGGFALFSFWIGRAGKSKRRNAATSVRTH